MNGEVFRVDSDAGPGRVRDKTVDVIDFLSGSIGTCDGLERHSCHRNDHVVGAAGDLLGDGVCGPDVLLGVEAFDRDVLTINVAAGFQRLGNSCIAIFHDGLAGILHECDAFKPGCRFSPDARFKIGPEEDSGGSYDECEAKD